MSIDVLCTQQTTNNNGRTELLRSHTHYPNVYMILHENSDDYL